MEQKVLHLTLKKKWFDMIGSGEKKEEYREIKKYWAVRLCTSAKYKGNNKGLLPEDKDTYWNGFYPIYFAKFDYVKLTNGYGKNAPIKILECLGISIGIGNVNWGAENGKEYFVIKLGKIITNG